MTTITIENDIKLQKTNFVNIDELLNYLLSIDDWKIDFEEFSQDEINKLDNLKSMNEFKSIVSNLKI